MPAKTAVRSHVHAARPVVGAVLAGVEGQPEAVQHSAGVCDARRGDDDRRRGVVDPMSRGGLGPAGRKGRGRVPRMDRGAGQRPEERVRLRFRRHIRSGNAAGLPWQTGGAPVAHRSRHQGSSKHTI